MSWDRCFITEMHRRAMESDIIIVNHHLLCADAAVRQGEYGEVIPACAYGVIDEAHQRCRTVLNAHRDKLEVLANRLIEVETVEGDELLSILGPAEGHGGDAWETRANYVIIRTMEHDGSMVVYSCGQYRDVVVFENGQPKFASRHVVYDSRMIETVLVIPI